jgi:hypothetical protein
VDLVADPAQPHQVDASDPVDVVELVFDTIDEGRVGVGRGGET